MVAARSEVTEEPGCVSCVGVGEPIVRVMASPQHRGKEAFGSLSLAWTRPRPRERDSDGQERGPKIQTSMPRS